MAASAPQHHGVPALRPLSQVHVHQKTTFGPHKYMVTTEDGQELFYAKETSCLGVYLGGSQRHRPFKIKLRDLQGREVITLRKEIELFAPNKMEVFVGSELVSIVRRKRTFMTPVFKVNDPSDRLVLRVKGPKFQAGEADYQVFTPNEVPVAVGVINKLWGGLDRELFTRSDNFLISFPTDLHDNYV